MFFIELLGSLAHSAPGGVDDFSTRMGKAISQSQQDMRIELSDMLGEGESAWDSDPRYPTESLNCMTWLQWVLAMAYSPNDLSVGLDSIRYYQSEPYFTTRKHYIDRWVMLEPGPLLSVAETLEGHKRKTIQLDLSKLKSERQYTCELYAPFQSEVTFSYLSSEDFLNVYSTLKADWYVVFPVAKPAYYTVLYPSSGPMGQVHSMVLDLRVQTPKLWHASIDYGRVVHETPEQFAHRMRDLIEGFTVYALNPNWTPQKQTTAMLPSTAQSIECEKALHAP